MIMIDDKRNFVVSLFELIFKAPDSYRPAVASFFQLFY
jgi:hypothetical protein